MQLSPEQWAHIEILGGTVVPILLFWLDTRRTAKKRHHENLDKFTKLIGDRMYHPPHSHKEIKGPLMAENIQVSPLKINGN